MPKAWIAQWMLENLGREETTRLVSQLGGRAVMVPLGTGPAHGGVLRRLLSPVAFDRLVGEFGGCVLRVPKFLPLEVCCQRCGGGNLSRDGERRVRCRDCGKSFMVVRLRRLRRRQSPGQLNLW